MSANAPVANAGMVAMEMGVLDAMSNNCVSWGLGVVASSSRHQNKASRLAVAQASSSASSLIHGSGFVGLSDMRILYPLFCENPSFERVNKNVRRFRGAIQVQFSGQSALTAFRFFKRREKSFAGYILF